MHKWYQWLPKAMEMSWRRIGHIVKETVSVLENQGFINIKHQVVELPMSVVPRVLFRI